MSKNTELSEKKSLDSLGEEITVCRKCPRLVEFRESVSRQKTKRYANFEYWGRPVTGCGDPEARLAVVGLAPASHGGNRTGRVFTGDSSARFLIRHLHMAGYASQPTSETRNDGLTYRDCYVTAVVRCVPPRDMPTRIELDNCAPFFEKEFELLKNLKAVLALGKTAFDSFIRFAKSQYGIFGSFKFEHGRHYNLSQHLPALFASYHPSPRNTNTGKLTDEMFSEVLSEVRSYLTMNQ